MGPNLGDSNKEPITPGVAGWTWNTGVSNLKDW